MGDKSRWLSIIRIILATSTIQDLYLFCSAKRHNVIGNDAKEIWKELVRFRNGLQVVENHYRTPLPFVYKIVVVSAVYSYLLLSLVAEQDIGMTHIELYFPLFGVLKVIFFVGWLKAALAMENPLKTGDFHLQATFERHLKVCRVLVGEHD